MFDEMAGVLDMTDEHDHSSCEIRLLPVDHDPERAAASTGERVTFLLGCDGDSNPLPLVIIMMSKARGAGRRGGDRARGTWVTGENWFEKDPVKRFPGMPKVKINGVEYEGRVYTSEQGGVTDEILEMIIEDLVAPRFPDRSETLPAVILADGHKTRFAINVLNACKRLFVVILMGVPNLTHLWQVPDLYNNGLFKMLWVFVKRWWLDMKRLDTHNRVPYEQKLTISKSDVVVLFSKIFDRSFAQVEKNRGAIAKSGVRPFTRSLNEHPVIVRNSNQAKFDVRAATDAAVATVGDSAT